MIWLSGALFLAWWSDELWQEPFANVCRPAVDPPYAECLSDEARRVYESGSLGERAWARLRAVWETPEQALAPDREIPRWRSGRWRSAARDLLGRQLAWLVAVWGPFLLLAWAFAGFRRDPPAPDGDPAA